MIYARNLVLQSPLTGIYYFVPKAEVLPTGGYRVIGKKIDVSESIETLFGALLRETPKPRAKEPAKRKPAR
jgi:hypothetical protein